MNRKPRVPERACFRKVAIASVVANVPATHLTVMFYLKFLKAVSVWSKKFFQWELYTCLLVSKVKCFFIYDILFFKICVFSGRLPKVDQFMVCQNSGKFELSNFKKSLCAHIAKHMIIFGEALVVISTLKKNVLVVTCTFNLKIKIFSLWAL